MNYEFPVITHIDEVLAAIAGREEFVVKHDEANGYKVVNYLVNFEDTFPPVTDRRTALLRECRGITFDAETGKVISRKYHKFFNQGERPETLPQNVNMLKNKILLEKLDGSMITFLRLKDGSLRACTKMGLTEIATQVDGFITNHANYAKVIHHCIDIGQTPIFEWCSRQQRIVIDYPEDRLVLTAIRVNDTGEYLSYESMGYYGGMHNIDIVKPHSGEIHDGEEGYVIRFEDGHMMKVKGGWYVQLHKTLDHLRFEKDVIRLIIDEKIDDAKAFLPADLVAACDAFAKQIFTNVMVLSDKLFWEVQAAHDNLNGSKKRFAESIQGNQFAKFLFQCWDHLEEGEPYLRKVILTHVSNNLSTQNKVNTLRNIIGEKTWWDYHKPSSDLDD
jgi:RNA ligase